MKITPFAAALNTFIKGLNKTPEATKVKDIYPEAFLQAIIVVLEHEGGYVNDPDDPGGETKYGISKRTYPNEDIANLTRERAIEIYYNDWWKVNKYDTYPHPKLAAKVFDTAINVGKKPANKILQRAIRANGHMIDDDGIVGEKTFGAMAKCEEPSLLTAFRSEQAGYYRVLIAKKDNFRKYEKGWLKRAYS